MERPLSAWAIQDLPHVDWGRAHAHVPHHVPRAYGQPLGELERDPDVDVAPVSARMFRAQHTQIPSHSCRRPGPVDRHIDGVLAHLEPEQISDEARDVVQPARSAMHENRPSGELAKSIFDGPLLKPNPWTANQHLHAVPYTSWCTRPTMPNLGETWDALESSDGGRRVQAVIIATSPAAVRLVTRTGRRITLPVASLERAWRWLNDAPEIPSTCSLCRQTAYFRHNIESEVRWVCEDHLPHGAKAYFPGDQINEDSAGLEVNCPSCHSTQISLDPTLVPLLDHRSTTLHTCGDCRCAWSPLLSLGLGDDGTNLAQDLRTLISRDVPVNELRLGFVAYRNLCRALGMGNVPHVGGVSLVVDHQLGDMLTLVFYRSGQGRAAPRLPDSPPVPVFGAEFPSWPIAANSVWRRRSSPNTCRVLAADASNVTCAVAGEPEARSYTPKDFLRRWMPPDTGFSMPTPLTIWRHIETHQLVQVVEPTPVQAVNHQVQYVTSDGRLETTPETTFHRLYREVPMPVENHFWHWREPASGDASVIFEADRAGDVFTVRRFDDPGARPARVARADFCECFAVAELFDSYLGIDPRAYNANDVRVALRAHTRWTSRLDPTAQATIIELAKAGSNVLVHYRDEKGTRFASVDAFMQNNDYLAPEPPCKEGETWASLTAESRHGVIIHADAPPFERAVIEWNDGSTESIPHAKLTSLYRKLDIRSYWEILDLEDAP